MGKRFILSESEKSEIRRLYDISEQMDMEVTQGRESEPKEGKRLFCNQFTI